MYRHRRQRGGGIGVLLVAERLYAYGLDTVGPVTLLTIGLQSLLFLGILKVPWRHHGVCLSAESILRYRNYPRLFLSPLNHADDAHLYHNMVSFLLKGRSLENRFGSVKFFLTLVAFMLATSLTYVGLAWAAAELFESYSYMKQCAIGFSGVVFALKVLTTHYERRRYSEVFCFTVLSKYAVWAELVIIHILVPNASFIGHVAGILVGLAYVYGPLGVLIDAVHAAVVG